MTISDAHGIGNTAYIPCLLCTGVEITDWHSHVQNLIFTACLYRHYSDHSASESESSESVDSEEEEDSDTTEDTASEDENNTDTQSSESSESSTEG